ncbi:ABC transporter ATP-binding protein [Brevibacterium gallinarum]|uniref:ABC transporter ATP-binding protein n=1 Tax=Brevibacterium gallinarum TaxID=2762220 RepID=A0ABR8WRV3_9MICO|nr:ABC transporter ATP-binding protein [Brevibacterium gallinarum]MBD8019657.1 ABC transporter ATP-binding protein [Brevibacterium gallinarum]
MSAGALLRDTLRFHWRPLSAAAGLSVVGALLSLGQPLVVNHLIESISAGTGTASLTTWIAGLVLLVIGAAVVDAGAQLLVTRTAESAIRRLRSTIVLRVLRLPMRVLDRQRSGDLVTRVGSDATLVREMFTGGLVDVFGGLLLFVGAIAAMVWIDPVMLAIVLGIGGTAVIVVIAASAKIQTLTLQAQNAVGDLSAQLDRAISAVRTIRAANAEQRVGADMDAMADRAYYRGVRIARIEAMLGPVSGLTLQVAFLAVLGIGGMRVATGAISVADLVSFILFLFLIAAPLGQAFSAITTVRAALGAFERIRATVSLPLEGEQDPPHPAGCTHELGPRNEISAHAVGFAYEPGRPVLTDVSFSIADGSTTAIVGPSGSGKSTLLALLERFYDPDSGVLSIDGTDITSVSRQQLRTRIGYVEQQPPALAGTVRENLLLGAPAATDEECASVLAAVRLTDRFDAAEGLDTQLGERGVNLSGGQRQRLALARTLLADPGILLLDEPTASVDSLTEEVIQDAIARHSHNRTTVIVAHRLSTVTAADQILVLADGQIEAAGTHTELLETSSLYRDLADRQLLT